ncbi:MAG TPA: glycosyltransferase family 39 protein [Gammaproteobacteria bacterium]|nr:glycosyltransferase family 39 protein [Gammaproteobacteria bacterium]
MPNAHPSPNPPRLTTGSALGLLVAVLVVLTAYRLTVLLTTDLGLYGDEAYYFTWSLHPDWGYYSKPPMVAWLIAASTSLLGATPLGVKAPSLVLYPATALVLFAIARRLYGPGTGLIAGVTFATLPGVFFGSMVINTDVPLLLFWALALWAFLWALERDRPVAWAAAGAATGLGLLSKYTMAVFPLTVVLYLLADPRLRRHLARPGPWLAAAVALALFMPNLIWNARHGFITVAHTASISHLDEAGAHSGGLAAFLAAQFGMFGPVFMGVLTFLAAGWGGGYRREPERILLAFAAPLLVLISLQSWLGQAHANWAAPAYLAGTVLVAGWLLRRSPRLLATGLAVNVALGLFLYHYQGIAHTAGIQQVPSPLDPRARVRGWDRLAAAVERVRATFPGTPLLADDRFVVAELQFYLHPRPADIGYWNPGGKVRNQYALSADIGDRQGQDFLLVARGAEAGASAAPYFREWAGVGSVTIRRGAGKSEVYRFWIMRGFRGYGAVAEGSADQ